MTESSGFYRSALEDHKGLLRLSYAYMIFVITAAVIAGAPWWQILNIHATISGVFTKCVVILLLAALMLYCRYVYGAFRRGSGVALAFRESGERLRNTAAGYLGGEVFAYGVVALIVVCAIHFFYIQKCLIGIINPYNWDPQFAALDKFIHFGRYPHEWLNPVIDALGLARLLDLAYVGWFFMMYATVGYAVLFDANRKRRLHFLWALLLTWLIVASFFATVFSSVGPIFYNHFYPHIADVYQDLLVHFIDNPNTYFFRLGRHVLMQWEERGQILNPNAISAMPSVHVAIAFLAALYFRQVNKWAYIAAAIFCVLIFLGSVYSGFHYAIDGYFSVAAVTLIWHFSKKTLDRHPPKGARQILQRVVT